MLEMALNMNIIMDQNGFEHRTMDFKMIFEEAKSNTFDQSNP